MIIVKDFSNWIPYEGFAEGSGRSEKLWLQSEEGIIGLFKYPKIDPETRTITYEHIAEHLAYLIGRELGIKTALVDIGIYNNRYGCISYLLNRENEAIIEGAMFIIGKHPDYNIDLMMEESTGRYYCIDHLFEVSDSDEVKAMWIQMMFFDFLIGNSDRHQNNWAFMMKYTNETNVCPLYDNGSSLCCYVNDILLDAMLGNDINRFKSLVDSKSRSMIRIDGFTKKRPKHSDVVKYLLHTYSYSKQIADRFIDTMTSDKINSIISSYPDDLVDTRRKQLLQKFLNSKIEILKKLRNEV